MLKTYLCAPKRAFSHEVRYQEVFTLKTFFFEHSADIFQRVFLHLPRMGRVGFSNSPDTLRCGIQLLVTSEWQLSYSYLLSLREIYATVGSLYQTHPHLKKITKAMPTDKKNV